MAEQIDSIRAQSFSDWKLVVRDDGSTDDTAEIVRRFGTDSRISLLDDSRENIGPWASFGRLLSFARNGPGEYFFLSDQDDVWLANKIEQQIQKLREGAASGKSQSPMLVHSDPEVVDESLGRIHPAFSDFQGMWYDHDDPLSTLLIHNAVVGCTIAFNRSLLEFAVPIPAGVMHDWWLAVCAAAVGSVSETRGTAVLYRQHEGNVMGTPGRHAFLKRLLGHPFRYVSEAFHEFDKSVVQSQRLLERLVSKGVTGRNTNRVARYVAAFSTDGGAMSRLRALSDSGARPQRLTSRLIIRGICALYPFAPVSTNQEPTKN